MVSIVYIHVKEKLYSQSMDLINFCSETRLILKPHLYVYQMLVATISYQELDLGIRHIIKIHNILMLSYC